MGPRAARRLHGMQGGSHSHLMLCEADTPWVVKFQHNPQGSQILVNELLATRLAAYLGFTVPPAEVIEVSEAVIASFPSTEKPDDGQGTSPRYRAGRHFASRYVPGPMSDALVDCLADDKLMNIINISEFAGMLCFDKWTSNTDARQVVFSRKHPTRQYHAYFIDHGFCFGANTWTFCDAPLRGIYSRPRVYTGVTGWDSFEPWLSRLEEISAEVLVDIADSIPLEWYNNDVRSLARLVETLWTRRNSVHTLISECRGSRDNPFPNWIRMVPIAQMP